MTIPMTGIEPTERTPFPGPGHTRHFSNILLKFSRREFLEEFRAGYVFLRPQGYFTDLENDVLRMDRFETVDRIIQPSNVRDFRMENPQTGQVFHLQPVSPILINMGIRNYNLFCMYSIPTSHCGSPQVDPRCFAFGDSFVAVLDSQKFLNRVGRAAKKLGFSLDCHLVEYFDPDTHEGEVGPFRKPKSFDYQQEFRIIITPGAVEPVKLKVRTLKDITTPIFSLAEINTLIEMNTPPPVRIGVA
jgi:hypothetical protein